MRESLTASERETIIVMDDDGVTADVFTHQRRWHTRLMHNPAFELIEDLSWKSTVGGHFRGPAALVSIRKKRISVSCKALAEGAEA